MGGGLAQTPACAVFHVKHFRPVPALQVQLVRVHGTDERLAAQRPHLVQQAPGVGRIQLGTKIVQQHDARTPRVSVQVADLGQQQAGRDQFLLPAGAHVAGGLAVQQELEVGPVRAIARSQSLPFPRACPLKRFLQGPVFCRPAPMKPQRNFGSCQ